MSDDGARLKYKDPRDDTWKELINNDGDHPTRLGCGTTVISMNRRTQIPLEIIYYQGPRFHIANILLWRKATEAGKDPLCGQSGNSLYFDADKQSAPQQAYKDLLARAWKPVTAENLWLDGTYNPCVAGKKPVISQFQNVEISITSASFRWATNIPASTQIRLINVATGEEILTNTDNLLRTNHEVFVTGLRSGTTYRVQAVSISQDLGNTLSDELIIKTL